MAASSTIVTICGGSAVDQHGVVGRRLGAAELVAAVLGLRQGHDGEPGVAVRGDDLDVDHVAGRQASLRSSRNGRPRPTSW